jgi:uncharacterized protein
MAKAHVLAATCLASLLTLPVAAQTAAPSFDCARATSADEREICADDRLAELDRVMNAAYAEAAKSAPQYGESKKEHEKSVKGAARTDVADRRHCGAAVLCILDQQVAAIQSFAESGATTKVPDWVGDYRRQYAGEHPEIMEPKLPKALGHCAHTKITALTDRGGGPLKKPKEDDGDMGAAVEYANGGYQVSYVYEEPLARSRVGDEVLLCLSSIPRDCPPGDARGRFYSGTNLRTGASWLLPDASHMCGGA